MMALLVAVLTASSALVAVWPLVQGARVTGVVQVSEPAAGASPVTVTRRRQGCRRVSIIVTRKPGEVQQGCSSARKRPCPKPRRW
jgi:hypothetical protein